MKERLVGFFKRKSPEEPLPAEVSTVPPDERQRFDTFVAAACGTLRDERVEWFQQGDHVDRQQRVQALVSEGFTEDQNSILLRPQDDSAPVTFTRPHRAEAADYLALLRLFRRFPRIPNIIERLQQCRIPLEPKHLRLEDSSLQQLLQAEFLEEFLVRTEGLTVFVDDWSVEQGINELCTAAGHVGELTPSVIAGMRELESRMGHGYRLSSLEEYLRVVSDDLSMQVARSVQPLRFNELVAARTEGRLQDILDACSIQPSFRHESIRWILNSTNSERWQPFFNDAGLRRTSLRILPILELQREITRDDVTACEALVHAPDEIFDRFRLLQPRYTEGFRTLWTKAFRPGSYLQELMGDDELVMALATDAAHDLFDIYPELDVVTRFKTAAQQSKNEEFVELVRIVRSSVGLDQLLTLRGMGIFEQLRTVDCARRPAYFSLLRRISHSQSRDLQRVKNELAMQLLAQPDPEGAFQAIDEVFERNNIPFVGKLFRVFQILHPPNVLQRGLNPWTSPYLRQASMRRRYQTIFTDLLRVHIESNNPSLRQFVETLAAAETALQTLEQDADADWPPDQRRAMTAALRRLEALQMNSGLEDPQAPSQGAVLATDDLRASYRRLRDIARVPDGKSLLDRYVEMFARPLGYQTVGQLLAAMDAAVLQAHERGLATAREIESGQCMVKPGDLIKGVNSLYIASLLSRGFTAPEFLGAASDQDATHYDTDAHRVQPAEVTADVTARKIWSSYGNYHVVFRDRGQFSVSDNEHVHPERDRYEVITLTDGQGNVRTGIGSTQIDYMMVDDDFPDRDKNLSNLEIDIAQNGWYIPITNQSGKLIFSRGDFERLRQNFAGLDRFRGGDIPLVSEAPQVARAAVRTHAEKVAQQRRELLEHPGDTLAASASIQRTIGDVLAEERIELKHPLDTSLGGARLYDIGSTGRATNMPGDHDFDFTLKITDVGDDAPFQRAERIARTLEQRLGGTTASHTFGANCQQVRLHDSPLPDGGTADIDIAIMPSAEVDYIPTHQAVEERLRWIRDHHGEEAYQNTIANILVAKRTLKEGNAYKKVEHGGWGGVGVENWVLLSGGNFQEACRTFWEAAHSGTDVVPLAEFTARYPIVNPGRNFRDLQHDNYTRYLTQQGYEAMLRVAGQVLGLQD